MACRKFKMSNRRNRTRFSKAWELRLDSDKLSGFFYVQKYNLMKLNVRVAELTQQVRNVKWNNEDLETKLKEDVEKLSKEVQESNYSLSKRIEVTLNRITTTVTEIESLINIATGKAIDSAARLLNDGVKEATDMAVAKMNEGASKLISSVEKTKREIDKVKDDIYFERGFRKFMFWATPILLFAQSIAMALLLLR